MWFNHTGWWYVCKFQLATDTVTQCFSAHRTCKLGPGWPLKEYLRWTGCYSTYQSTHMSAHLVKSHRQCLLCFFCWKIDVQLIGHLCIYITSQCINWRFCSSLLKLAMSFSFKQYKTLIRWMPYETKTIFLVDVHRWHEFWNWTIHSCSCDRGISSNE